tara:strand:- start:72 stop:1277 length:1206 start_codon:yes stop_codon:yes gene_type:complete
MRLGLFSPAWPGEDVPNGIVSAVANLKAGLEEVGHHAVVLAEGREPATDCVRLPPQAPASLGARILRRFRSPNAELKDMAAALARAASQAAAERAIDGFLVEETYGWGGLMQPHLAVPVVPVLHGPWFLHQALQSTDATGDEDRRRIAVEGVALRAAAGVSAPSRDVLDQTVAYYQLPESLPRAVIPNAIVAGRGVAFDALTERERRTLLFVGRFDRHKGGDVMLEAFAHLVAGGADAYLTFVGPDRGCETPGRGRVSLAEALAALPGEARARIDVRGPLPREEVARLRRRHPIAVVASRYENLNYTLLETLAVGAAPICTAVGGPKQVLRDGETGLLVPPEDPQALAAACRALLDDPERVRRIGAAARREALSVFAPAAVARQTVSFVEECRDALARRRR